MKRVEKTDVINQRLRAAFGPDADLAPLAVWETIALNTKPVRKGGGIFKGARNTLSLLTEISAAVNKESAPLQLQHDVSAMPSGRFFYCEMVDDQLRGLFAVNETLHPDIAANLDSGVIDQVSVNFLPKALNCSSCGYNFADPANIMGLITLTCDEEHHVGQDGVFVWVDGLDQFYELSLVGKGGAEGARIVGPSDSRLAQSNENYRLAAAANPGLLALEITPTQEDPSDMNAEQLAAFQAAISGQATATVQLAAVTAERDAQAAQVVTLTAQLTEAQAANAESIANRDAAAAALTAMQAEAKTVLTALGKADTITIPADVTACLALITEHRAAFAAIIPVNGASNASDADTENPKARTTTNSAFRAPK